MDAERAERLESLFHDAVAREPDERRAWLDAACAGDRTLLADVASLIEAHEEAEGFLDESPGAPAAPGARVFAGGYLLDERIGAGGMGTVYRARLSREGFERVVALKLLSPLLANGSFERRFRAERRALAALDHPHIARFLDGGVTGEEHPLPGLPFLVMELVDGVPIDRWCRERDLPVRARIELFLLVCGAVQHAHAKLVMHRDLKPENVLVADDERGGADPKVLDFGISRVLDDAGRVPSDGSTTLQLLTPSYASPEQVRGEKEITTATDVYSLGVMLYELLAGARPYELAGKAPTEIERTIAYELPPAPSLRSGNRELRGDLDNVVLKALAKEPERRYPTVEALAEDLRRHLDGRAVEARPGGPLYHAGKLARRNRAAVLACALVVLSLIGARIAASIGLWRATAAEEHAVEEAGRAEREARVAGEVSEALVELFRLASPAVSGRQLSVPELLDRADGLLASVEEPEVRARLVSALLRANLGLGRFARAVELGDEAVELWSSLRPRGDLQRLATDLHLARALIGAGEEARAEGILRDVLGHVGEIEGDEARLLELKGLVGVAALLDGDGDGERTARFATWLATTHGPDADRAEPGSR